MEINYSKFIHELAKRTLANYYHIKEMSGHTNGINKCNFTSDVDQNNPKLYEVTQLINSMYSLLVIPEEIFGIRRINPRSGNQESDDALKTEFSTREKRLKKHDAYRNITVLLDKLKAENRLYYSSVTAYEQDYPVCAFINSLRNALCHDGIGFIPFQTDFGGKLTNQIDHIIFESRSSDKKSVVFMTILSIEQLEYLLVNVSEMYCNVEDGKNRSDEQKYKKFYTQLADDVKQYMPDCKINGLPQF